MTEAFVVMCITVLLAFAAGVALGIALQLPKDWTEPPEDWDIVDLGDPPPWFTRGREVWNHLGRKA